MAQMQYVNAAVVGGEESTFWQGKNGKEWTEWNQQRTLPVTLFNLITFPRLGDMKHPLDR